LLATFCHAHQAELGAMEAAGGAAYKTFSIKADYIRKIDYSAPN
jgi:hypothetical protein